jgi:hypothetical protein
LSGRLLRALEERVAGAPPLVREDDVNTLKSAAVILVLAGVLYGVYTALNTRPTPPPAGMTERDLADIAPPEIDFALAGGSDASPLAAPPAPLTLSSESRSPAELPPSSNLPAASPSPSIYGPADAQPPSTSPPAGQSAEAGSYNRRSSFETPEGAEDKGQRTEDSSQSPALAAASFRRDRQLAEQQVADGKFRAALATLSSHCQAELSSEDRTLLLAWLDALAAKVIYSREHLLDQPYVVRGRETLFDVAQQLHVPAELLANINGVTDPRILLQGTELKVVPGPMRTDVHLAAGELTLFLGDLYAGRFPISVGNEPPPPGEYSVQNKAPDRTYIGPDGRTIAANDPTNPYGQCWIDLGPAACIHGSPQSAAPGTQTLGCISLSPQDARDVYAMLVPGSKVVVRR